MSDLETQLRRYSQRLVERQQPVTVEEILAGLEQPVRRRRLWVRRGLAVAVAAVLVLLVAGVVTSVVDLVGGRVQVPVIGEPPQEAEAPPPGLPAAPEDWSRVLLPEGALVRSIVAGGSGLVAAGSQLDDGTPWQAMWMSPDGRGWTPAELERRPGAINLVTATPFGLMAVGGDVETAVVDVWTSEDGLVWSRAPDDPVFTDAWVQAMTTGGPGVVALGTLPDGPQAWFSADGLSWERALVPPLPPDVPMDHGRRWAGITDVAVSGDRLIAIGTLEDARLFMWTSDNGMTWTDLPVDPTVFPVGSTVGALTDGPRGLVAVGSAWDTQRDTYVAAAWTSPDGVTWQRAPSAQDAFVSDFPYGFGWGGMRSVAANSSGYVAVGGDGQCGGEPCPTAQAAVWTSLDGWTWKRVPSAPVFEGPDWVGMYLVATWDSRFVAAGEHDGRWAVWVSRPGHE